ncbi:MAG: hypothetical protein AAF614_20380 [Chloroflexota bacterium]
MNRKYIFLATMTIFLLVTGWVLGQSAVGQAIAQAGPRAALSAVLGTGFTYQGQLQDNGVDANGSYDFEFSLYDDTSSGSQVGSTIAQTLTVTEGLFTTNLDFGAAAFNGEARFLEIAVQLNGGGGFTTLTPRQPITAVPYATFASKVQPVDNIIVVAKSGGDFTTIGAALAAITDASATNPYLIRIGPGIYEEIVDLKSHVDIEGSGSGVTIIRGDGGTFFDGNNATIRANGISSAELRLLTVESIALSNSHSTAIWAYDLGAAVSFTNITASGSAGSNTNHGISIFGASSSPKLDNVQVSASGGQQSNAIDIASQASPRLTNIIATASGATIRNYAIYVSSASPTMNNITANASDGSDRSAGVHNRTASTVMTNVHATATGATNNQAVYNYESSPVMNNVTAFASGTGNNWGILNEENSTPTMNNVTATVSGGVNGTTNIGIENLSSSPMMNQVTATATGSSGTGNRGVYNENSSPSMNNMTVSATGGSVNYGVYNFDSSSPEMDNILITMTGSRGIFNDRNSDPTIQDSAIRVPGTSIQNVNGSSMKVAYTMIEGSVSGGAFTCLGAYRTNFTARNSICN